MTEESSCTDDITTETLPNNMERDIDPIHDIVDYLVRCAKISFRNAHINENEIRTTEKIKMACDMYKECPTKFLLQFGKYLTSHHIKYFENCAETATESFRNCVMQLKEYHSEGSRHKRIRNRRYNALLQFKSETDYFSEKQMMYRNPLLYEQLVGQYMSDEEIWIRDRTDVDNMSFLNIVLEAIDHNQMREIKNEQQHYEDSQDEVAVTAQGHCTDMTPKVEKLWGEFQVPDTTPKHVPEKRKQALITAPERNLLREEFVQEMYNSFMEGRDPDVDYNAIDCDEKYDDLQQLSQDAEDRYFDSETNEETTLEQHMKLIDAYRKINLNENVTEDPLDEFMKHMSNQL